MPTAARVVAGIALGFASVIMVFVLISFYPDERWDREQTDLVRLFFAVGALVGWYSLGKRVAVEEGSGIYLGLRAAITVTVWLLFLLSVNFVISRIIDNKLRGADPMQAIFEMFEKAAEYAYFLLDLRLIAIIAFAGITVGVLTKNTQKRWK